MKNKLSDSPHLEKLHMTVALHTAHILHLVRKSSQTEEREEKKRPSGKMNTNCLTQWFVAGTWYLLFRTDTCLANAANSDIVDEDLPACYHKSKLLHVPVQTDRQTQS